MDSRHDTAELRRALMTYGKFMFGRIKGWRFTAGTSQHRVRCTNQVRPPVRHPKATVFIRDLLRTTNPDLFTLCAKCVTTSWATLPANRCRNRPAQAGLADTPKHHCR